MLELGPKGKRNCQAGKGPAQPLGGMAQGQAPRPGRRGPDWRSPPWPPGPRGGLWWGPKADRILKSPPTALCTSPLAEHTSRVLDLWDRISIHGGETEAQGTGGTCPGAHSYFLTLPGLSLGP